MFDARNFKIVPGILTPLSRGRDLLAWNSLPGRGFFFEEEGVF